MPHPPRNVARDVYYINYFGNLNSQESLETDENLLAKHRKSQFGVCIIILVHVANYLNPAHL